MPCRANSCSDTCQVWSTKNHLLRATTRIERTALVNEVLVEYIAELLGRDPSEIDP